MCITSIITGALVTVGVVLIGLGAGLGWGLFPVLVKDNIASQVALKNGSEAWDLWVEIPIAMRFKVYLFEVTNPLEVMAGAKPSLNQRGPYIYDEWRKKQDMVLNKDGTEVTYSQVTTFTFNQELSGDLKESDRFTMLNAALMGAILIGDKDNGAGLSIINGAAANVFPNDPNPIFSTNTVKEVLFDGQRMKCTNIPLFNVNWGLFCAGLKSALPETIRPELNENGEETGDLLYSYFNHKNKNTDGVYTVNTGLKNSQKLGQIQKWGEDMGTLNETLPYWAGPECNKITGTDAAIFPPFLTSKTVIDIFSTDLCRSLYAVYQEDIVYEGVPGLRFVADDLQLGTVHDTPDNYCYCAENSACLKRGTLDLYACVDAPVILTFPHFFQASEDYLSMVTGLAPEKEKHQTYLDLEPYTGIPLSGGKRVQFNMMMKQVRGVDSTTGVPSALIPLLWIDEGLDLDPPNVERLKSDVLGTLSLLDGLRWGMIGFGIAFIGGGVVLWFVC